MDERQKLELQKKKIISRERALNAKTRRQENHQKYRLGGMVVKAGLHTLSDEQIIGALFQQKQSLSENPGIINEWEELGRKATFKPEKIPLVIKFTDKPDDAITKKVKAYGFKWNRITKQWEGMIENSLFLEIRGLIGQENITEVKDD